MLILNLKTILILIKKKKYLIINLLRKLSNFEFGKKISKKKVCTSLVIKMKVYVYREKIKPIFILNL